VTHEKHLHFHYITAVPEGAEVGCGELTPVVRLLVLHEDQGRRYLHSFVPCTQQLAANTVCSRKEVGILAGHKAP
jgi:hypothetical protein